MDFSETTVPYKSVTADHYCTVHDSWDSDGDGRCGRFESVNDFDRWWMEPCQMTIRPSVRSINVRFQEVQEKKLVPRSQLLEGVAPTTMVEHIAEGMQIRVKAYMAVGGTQNCYLRTETPKTWWQHFKRDVLARITKGSSTPWGKALERWAHRIEYDVSIHDRTFYSRACPHLPFDPQASHAMWVTDGKVAP